MQRKLSDVYISSSLVQLLASFSLKSRYPFHSKYPHPTAACLQLRQLSQRQLIASTWLQSPSKYNGLITRSSKRIFRPEQSKALTGKLQTANLPPTLASHGPSSSTSAKHRRDSSIQALQSAPKRRKADTEAPAPVPSSFRYVSTPANRWPAVQSLALQFPEDGKQAEEGELSSQLPSRMVEYSLEVSRQEMEARIAAEVRIRRKFNDRLLCASDLTELETRSRMHHSSTQDALDALNGEPTCIIYSLIGPDQSISRRLLLGPNS